MSLWNIIGEILLFRWLFKSSSNDTHGHNTSYQSDIKPTDRHSYISDDSDDLDDFMTHHNKYGDYDHGSYQSYDDFHEEQDDYDMFDDF